MTLTSKMMAGSLSIGSHHRGRSQYLPHAAEAAEAIGQRQNMDATATRTGERWGRVTPARKEGRCRYRSVPWTFEM